MAIPASASTKGRIRNILEGLYTWLDSALDDADYANYYVSQDYKFNVMNTSSDPIVTIRVTPTVFTDELYGRIWQGDTGDTAMSANYLFSLHVFSKYNTGIGEDQNRDAWIAARIVTQYLNTLSRATMSARGIWNIDNMRLRESDPQIRNMGRIIIDGRIQVIREDSP